MQLGQVAESSTNHRPRTLPSQPKHAKVVTALRSGKKFDNGVVFIPEEELPILPGQEMKAEDKAKEEMEKKKEEKSEM